MHLGLSAQPNYGENKHKKLEFEILRGILDRKSTRLNSSHSQISYAVFCLKKKKNKQKEVSVKESKRQRPPTQSDQYHPSSHKPLLLSHRHHRLLVAVRQHATTP